MKKACILFLLAAMLFIPIQVAFADEDPNQNIVTITGDQINNASEIEAAIINATAQGSRPGTVILDGRNGPFLFTEEDRSINIFVADLTLRGVNHAVIENCDDGLFFDNFSYQHAWWKVLPFTAPGMGLRLSANSRM